MQIAHLGAPVPTAPQEVRAKPRSGREVDLRSSRRRIVISEEHATAEFEIRHHTPKAGKIPLQVQRIHSSAVHSVTWLKHDKCRDSIHSVLKSPPQRSGQMRIGQHPAVAQADVHYRRILRATGDAMAATRPYLHLVPARLRTINIRALGEGTCKEATH